ncbi:MAG: hypothetical protein LBF02_02615 [Mycoplasmataceae bacterium]|nr:hypothetical protein [Mycoplasmataceae bacterium]
MNKELTPYKVYDFDWIVSYLGINDEKIINKFLEMNKKNNAYIKQVKNNKDIDENNNKQENKEIIYEPLLMHTNKKFKANHIGHYLPISNLIEIKNSIDETGNDYFDVELVAHEFAHSLIFSHEIKGNRAGHGVNYYLVLMRDVIWNANHISMYEKFYAALTEFSYSCSLAQYHVTRKIIRSTSRTNSLGLEHFSINSFLNDKRQDLNNLGNWFFKIISLYLEPTKNDILTPPISDLIDKIMNEKLKNEETNLSSLFIEKRKKNM